jgi:hypothetical protein
MTNDGIADIIGHDRSSEYCPMYPKEGTKKEIKKER